VATDPKYAPQSSLNTKTGEWAGVDVDVANEIANRLGVELELQDRGWAQVSAGTWNDRWDVSVGSMTITDDRLGIFSFTPVYYYTPASVAVHTDNTSIQDVTADLDGKKVCVGESTTYESYLLQDLSLGESAPEFEFVVDDPQILSYTTDTDALDQLALGDGVTCDAAITALPTIQQYVDDGGAIKVVGDPLYYEPLAIAFDKASPIDNASLVDAVSQIVDEMHADGTLSSLSEKWYGVDITTTTEG
jgi:polar amino acid transport system substrate-binding protein